MGMKPIKSNIYLDVEHIIMVNKSVILTENIVAENRAHYTHERLIGQLK